MPQKEHLEWGLQALPLLDPRRKYTSLLNKIDLIPLKWVVKNVHVVTGPQREGPKACGCGSSSL